MTRMRKKQIQCLLSLGVSVFLLGGLFSSIPVTRAVYHGVFDRQFETAEVIDQDPADFKMERTESSFYSFGDRLSGFLYRGGEGEAQGLFVFAHGFGNASHRTYLPLFEALCERGFLVFAYDGAGVEDSEGAKGPRGLPRGVMDLESAVLHALGLPEAEGLPLILGGHSWGAYAAGCALSLFPECKGALLFAGFNRSEDMLLHSAKKYAGPLAYLGYPFIRAYEEGQFPAPYAELSAVEGIKAASCPVLVVGAEEDETVPREVGFDLFREALAENERVTLLLRRGRDHKNLFYSDGAMAYRESLRQKWKAEGEGESFEAYFASAPDRQLGFGMDEDLVKEMVRMLKNGEGF